MGRSALVAVGAVTGALAAGTIGLSRIGALLALAVAALLVVAELRPRTRVRQAWPVAVGTALIVGRLTLMPAAPSTGEPVEGFRAWTLVVVATGSPREGHQTATLGTPPEAATPLVMAATLPRYPELIPGDRVVVEGEVRPPPDTPYGEYLRRIGAVGTISSRTLAVIERPTDPRSRLEGLRRGAAAALGRVLPEPEAGLAAGILIGLRDRVDRDLAAAFTTAGVSHVVAISGWNIAIVAAAVAALTGRVRRRRRSLITIVTIATYVAFAGASASVVRAAAMAGVVLVARESGRAGRAAAALGWAVTLLLLSDPELIGDAGFQLSSLATAGLIAWASPLTARIERLSRGRVPGWLAESLGVSLAAQAATLPIVLASFGRLALLSPLINLVVVPLVAPAMAVGLVALVGGLLVGAGLPSALGAVMAAPGWVVMRLLVSVVEAAATLPFASVTLSPPWDSITAAGTLVGLGALVRRRRGSAERRERQPTESGGTTTPRQPRDHAHRAQRAATGALVLAVAVTGGVLATRPGGIPKVTVLDIGQGDAILVEGSRGGRLLVDGGPDPDRLLVALDKRVPPWDRRIDTLILSHPHEDHVAGLVLLLARYEVRTVLEVGMKGPGPGYGAWDSALRDGGAPERRSIGAGDRLRVDEIDLRVLWPRHGEVSTEPPDGGTGINNVSVVLAGSVVGRSFLLMGDVEEAIDPVLLAAGLPQVDLLKVAHHGSRTATTQEFVDAVRPRIAVASAGADNPYGHPTRQTLERLIESGARVLRTDRDGSVVVSFSRQGTSLRAEGVREIPARPRPAPAGAARVLRCAIPVVALIPEREATRGGGAASRSIVPSRWHRAGGYHRVDDRARAGGGRRPPALPGSPTLATAALARRRGGGRLAGGAHLATGRGRRSCHRRVGGVAPRCRQGTTGRPPSARAPPRRSVGRLADRRGSS